MKKAIKFLSILFLFGGLLSLTNSQNIKTFATDNIYNEEEVVDNNDDDYDDDDYDDDDYDDDDYNDDDNKIAFGTVIDLNNSQIFDHAKKIATWRSQILKQHNGIMLGTGDRDKKTTSATLYIDKSKINLDKVKKYNKLFDMNEKFIIEIVDENGKKYVNKQYSPLFNVQGNFYFSFIPLVFNEKFKIYQPVLSPKEETVDKGFNFEVGKKYKIKLKKNDQTIMNEQVTAMDLDIMCKQLC